MAANSDNKYGNKHTEVDGIRFQSKAEARRYCELKLLQQAGEIRDLECQHPIPLDAYVFQGKYAGEVRHVADYLADFRYIDVTTGEPVYEDVKGGPSTTMFRLKRKWVEIEHNIKIKEIRG